MRDSGAIHTAGLGLTLGRAIDEHATLADFPTPGIEGRLAKALDSSIIYRDNASSWQVWVTPGGGGSASFPISEDVAGVTYSASVGSAVDGLGGTALLLQAVLDAGSVLHAALQLLGSGTVGLSSFNGGGIFVEDHGAGGTFFQDHDGGGTFFNLGGGGGIQINDGTHVGFTGAGGVQINTTSVSGGVSVTASSGASVTVSADGGIFLNLPTSPGTTGTLYSNGGIVTVSP